MRLLRALSFKLAVVQFCPHFYLPVPSARYPFPVPNFSIFLCIKFTKHMYAIQLIIVILKHPGRSNTEMIMNRENEIYVKKKKNITRRVCLSLLLATIIMIIIDLILIS